jgi:hypothetical protein
MQSVQVRRQPRQTSTATTIAELDLRTPAGRPLPY